MLIVAAQSVVERDPRLNGRAVRALMCRAHEAGARLVHFPEGALSGYPSIPDQDWGVVREELVATAALAGDLGIWVALGSNRNLTPPNPPHNSLYIISNTGAITGRYDKRLCSNGELLLRRDYSPGFDPVVVEIDGFRFGCVLCIEVHFPEIFQEYERLDVDCVLFSAHSRDPMFGILAQAHAETNGFWISVSVPAQFAPALSSGVIGPDGHWMAQCQTETVPDLALVRLDQFAPQFDVALNKARPWRRLARDGAIYRERRVHDPRSDDVAGF